MSAWLSWKVAWEDRRINIRADAITSVEQMPPGGTQLDPIPHVRVHHSQGAANVVESTGAALIEMLRAALNPKETP